MHRGTKRYATLEVIITIRRKNKKKTRNEKHNNYDQKSPKFLTIVKSNQTKQKSLNNKYQRKEIDKEYVIMILHYVICRIIVIFFPL